MEYLIQIILLLATAITVVVIFQRLHIPTSLGYLLVGMMLGPHTIGAVVSMPELAALAEFGDVFLLFTIGLNFSLPKLHALRHQLLGLGTGQVAFTTLGVGVVMWLAGLPVAAAFVFGAVHSYGSFPRQ
ncbi:MAG: cation:proton antiporter [Candidatus Nitrotoga sp.]